MSGWRLSLREAVTCSVDAQPICLANFRHQKADAIARVTLDVDGVATAIGELFTIAPLAGTSERLVLEGNLSSFDGVATNHQAGEFRVVGSVGDRAASAMRGGCLIVEGNVGEFTAAPLGTRRSGMRGGRVVITGSAGDYTGHRMRRGEIFIEGDTGDFTASHQVAGTIVAAGRLGTQPGYGMRRGTLITDRYPELSPGRFSSPTPIRSVFPTLLQRSLSSLVPLTPATAELIDRLVHEGPLHSIRGDLAVGGSGEILSPQGRVPAEVP